MELNSNRTVAGLKRVSNVETSFNARFQSNRCGVETLFCKSLNIVFTDSNRTVAGLKLLMDRPVASTSSLFQSNRCGVETGDESLIIVRERNSNRTVAGLKRARSCFLPTALNSNRTVAGLKRASSVRCMSGTEFQSNRCGVETKIPCYFQPIRENSNRTVAGLKLHMDDSPFCESS